MDRRIVIEHRDALVYMLVEAAEIEHAICCQYLFAAFGLKQSVDEGVDERRLRAIRRWQRTLLEIAAQEMLHFALVNNLLAAIGAAPRVGRPNLPVQGRHYPPGVQFALLPFGEAALRHFLFLERPEGITLVDAEGFESLREAEPVMDPDDIVPRPQDFGTVGELYRSIEEGFERLVDRYGEEWVFIGDESSQATPETFRWPELVAVTDLKTAKQAIDVVVEQGEGPRGHWRDAHYGRLLEVLGEYLTMRREDPAFEPSRPVVAAHCRQPVDTDVVHLISDPMTAKVMDAFNVAYEVLLYALARYFAHGHETKEQLDTLADVAVELMIFVIRPLGMALTELPVGDDLPGKTAGPAFELFHGSGYLLPHTWQAWVLLHERLAARGVPAEDGRGGGGAAGAARRGGRDRPVEGEARRQDGMPRRSRRRPGGLVAVALARRTIEGLREKRRKWSSGESSLQGPQGSSCSSGGCSSGGTPRGTPRKSRRGASSGPPRAGAEVSASSGSLPLHRAEGRGQR